MAERHQILAPVLDPLHRAADDLGRERNQKIFRIKLAARAETAADVVFEHAHRRLGELHHLRQRAPVVERHLADAGDRHALFRGVPIGDEAARLHRHRAVALHLEMLAADVRRIFERRIGVAERGRDRPGDVAAGFFEQENIGLARGIAVDHRGKRLDIDGDRLQCILGQRDAVGDHDGDRLADKADLVGGDDRLHVTLGRRQRVVPQRNRRYLADVGRGDHRMDAGPRAGRRRVDRADAAVRDGAAQDHRVQHFFVGEIVGVLAAPGEKAQILEPLDRAADEGVGGAARCGTVI